MKLTNYKGVSGIVWTWEDVKFLCPSLSQDECMKAVDEATTKMYSRLIDTSWELLELSLAELGYALEGTKREH
jgi:hypothetical protein